MFGCKGLFNSKGKNSNEEVSQTGLESRNVGENNSGHKFANTVTEGGTGKALSGHGFIDSKGGTLTVPKGTSLTTWTSEGGTLPDAMGKLIEIGKYQEILSSPEYVEVMMGNETTAGARTFLPGASVPRLMLESPEGLNIMSESITTGGESPLPLNKLMRRNMGRLDWAACMVYY